MTDRDLSHGTSLFQALRQMEDGTAVYGRTIEPRDEPARLAQALRTSFGVSDIEHLSRASDDQPATLEINAFGLFGPEGPMPLHLTWWMQRRTSERWYDEESGKPVADTGFLDFCNMLQHRMIGLFYRAWADTRPEVDADRGGSGPIGRMSRAMAGIGMPNGGTGDSEIDRMCLLQMTSFSMETVWPEKIELALQGLLNVPAQVREFIGNWMKLPEGLQSRLGAPIGGVLGKDCLAGKRVWMRQNRIEVVLGPLSRHEYRELLPRTERFNRLRAALSRVIGGGPDVDLRLVMAGDRVPSPVIGQVQLGYDAWLPKSSQSDAGDLCIRAIRATQRDHRK